MTMIDFIVIIVLLKIRHFWAHLALKYDMFRFFIPTRVTFPAERSIGVAMAHIDYVNK